VPEATEKLLIDIHELSQLTGIAIGTLYHWVGSGTRIPCVRLSARCLRFRREEIIEWINQLCNEQRGSESTQKTRRRKTA
jgi:predicted DNA-binding transcriptional regulator AlpA